MKMRYTTSYHLYHLARHGWYRYPHYYVMCGIPDTTMPFGGLIPVGTSTGVQYGGGD